MCIRDRIGVAALLLFSYLPLFGIIIAFKDYRINMGLEGIFTSEWVYLHSLYCCILSVTFRI